MDLSRVIAVRTNKTVYRDGDKTIKVFDKDYLTSAKQIELLKKKVSRLERDNEILKKTITLLAKKE